MHEQSSLTLSLKFKKDKETNRHHQAFALIEFYETERINIHTIERGHTAMDLAFFKNQDTYKNKNQPYSCVVLKKNSKNHINIQSRRHEAQ